MIQITFVSPSLSFSVKRNILRNILDESPFFILYLHPRKKTSLIHKLRINIIKSIILISSTHPSRENLQSLISHIQRLVSVIPRLLLNRVSQTVGMTPDFPHSALSDVEVTHLQRSSALYSLRVFPRQQAFVIMVFSNIA